jgi:16S rRNA (guanine966-N2)-methyltransferase
VEGAVVADLYAGSGAFGLEALSRGARSAIFVESGRKALLALKQNIESLGLGGSVVAAPVRAFLERCEDRFDLVFIDPPWPMSSDDLEEDFRVLDRLLTPGGELVASRRHTDRAPRPPETWRVAADKRYGDTRIFRYEKVTEDR